MPAHWRLRRRAASIDVPHPQNGSNTMSPSLDDAFTIRSSNASGFCVG